MTAALQLAIPGLAPGLVAGTGDALDRFYTPDGLARACLATWGWRGVRSVVEPSVGGGAFARAVRARWPGARIVGADIDPAAAGLALCDTALVGSWPELVEGGHIERPDIVVGNPPFTDDAALRHVEAALDLGANTVALILPWAYWGVERWAPLLDGRPPHIVRPIRPRPWPDRVREVALYVWERNGRGTTSILPLRWSAAGGGTPEQTKGPARESDAPGPASNLTSRGST